jgi:FkbM family methyltransferase
MLTESYDIILSDVFRRTLRQGDIVIDVGANVGYVSAVAASYVGPSGEVHGFEPLPECFERLQVLQALNPRHKLVFTNAALGEKPGALSISYDPRGGSRNATLVPGYSNPRNVQVPVMCLDDYVSVNICRSERIKVIKIDVEGFEFPVLLGAEKFLARSACRPLIVCEIKPYELRKCGFTIEMFDRYMKKFGYHAYDSVRCNKRLDLCSLVGMEVVLFAA